MGTINEVMLAPYMLEDNEIEEINNRCWSEFIASNGKWKNHKK